VRGQRRSALLWFTRADTDVWLVRRPDAGIWGGLWCLPVFDDIDGLRELPALDLDRLQALPPMRHALTHFDWELHPLRTDWAGEVQPPAGPPQAPPPTDARWWPLEQALDSAGLPAPIRKLLESARTA
jgi:A/G-specific adenine glycosylase